MFSSVQSLSCVRLCDPMHCSTPGFPVHHQHLELTQTHVHQVGDTIQPSHPLSSPFPPAFNLSQHQGLFKWVSSLHQVAKVLEFQLQHQSFQWIFRTDLGTHSHVWHRNGYYFHTDGMKLKLRDMNEMWVTEPCKSDSKAPALNHLTYKPWAIYDSWELEIWRIPIKMCCQCKWHWIAKTLYKKKSRTYHE